MTKLVVLLGVLCIPTIAIAGTPCDNGASKGSECEVVKVYTRCDIEKQTLRRRIALLERRVKELEAKTAIQTTVVYKEKRVTRVVEKDVIKHHILSVYAARDVSGTSVSTSGTTATATVQTAYQPGIKYQYQFTFGLVPEIGINMKGNPMVGLGFEF